MIHVLTQTLCSRLLQIFYSNAAKYELNLANRREYVILTRIFKTPSPRFSVLSKSWIGPRGEKTYSGQVMSDGQTDH